MREILFRGKTKNNEWVEGLYLTYDPKHYDCLENPSHVIVNNPEAIGCGLCIQESEMTGKNLAVYSDTIGQFTGLTDKNGKKIFEGDIVELDDGEVGCVVYRDSGFALSNGGCSLCVSSQTERMIIGNIHDNPELMEGE